MGCVGQDGLRWPELPTKHINGTMTFATSFYCLIQSRSDDGLARSKCPYSLKILRGGRLNAFPLILKNV